MIIAILIVAVIAYLAVAAVASKLIFWYVDPPEEEAFIAFLFGLVWPAFLPTVLLVGVALLLRPIGNRIVLGRWRS